MGRFVDLTGKRFGRLEVIEVADRGSRGVRWRCRCECGGEAITTSHHLTTGHSASCGCLQREVVADANRVLARGHRHGHTRFGGWRSPTYQTWSGMRDRCVNPNAHGYPWYGALGVTVCDRWSSFEAFLEDMGERPEGMTLDRIDPEGNYEPENCRWATASEQAQNTRRAKALASAEGVSR